MICRQDFYALVLMEPTPEPGDGGRRFQQGLGGKSTEGAYKIGLDRRNLALQKGKAGINLVGLGIPVFRWAAFDDIANIHLAAS